MAALTFLLSFVVLAAVGIGVGTYYFLWYRRTGVTSELVERTRPLDEIGGY
jgi:hypothetical protein